MANVSTAAAPEADQGLPLNRLREQFIRYATVKEQEILEARQASRYYHSKQFSKKQLEVLEKRKQPAIVFNRVQRKIDGIVGTIRRLRTDPKAFPRTPMQQEGADVATQVVRYVLDSSMFEDVEAEATRDASIHGIGVSEMTFRSGDHGDPDIGIEHVDPRTFFYDPRSTKPDFSDARYMGTYKWATDEELEEIMPGASRLAANGEDGVYFTSYDVDREILWQDDRKRYRLIDHWYIQGGRWRYCLHVGTAKLAAGDSPFFDAQNKTISKFFAFSCYIDDDADRYGFVRPFRGPQDAMNQHRSKAIHIMNTRQIVARRGAFLDIETARREVARPDGAVEYDGQRGDFEIVSMDQQFLEQTRYYEDAKAEIENFGPNPALVGTGVNAKSGRQYAMLQQTALADLGPFLKNYRMWKLAQYRAVWIAAQRYWTSERMIRVTDDEEVARFIQINGVGFDAMGQPALVNSLGSLDVDIIMDEGPDTETMMGDAFDTMQALAQNGQGAPNELIIEMSPLPRAVKDRYKQLASPQADPAQQAAQQQAQQIQLAGAAAQVDERRANAELKRAQAHKAVRPEPAQALQAAEQGPTLAEQAATMAKARSDQANADLKQAQTQKTLIEAALKPQELQHKMEQQSLRDLDRQMRAQAGQQ